MSTIPSYQSRLPAFVQPSLRADRLDSWKEIAGFFGREVRTVQLWEKNEALPVKRHKHNKSGTVFAYRAELGAWWNSRCHDSKMPGRPQEAQRVEVRGISSDIQHKPFATSWKHRDGSALEGASYDCMMGNYFWKQRGLASLNKALHYFSNALQADHLCAEAYAGISNCYVSLSYHHLIPASYAMSQATKASLEAVRIKGTSTVTQCA